MFCWCCRCCCCCISGIGVCASHLRPMNHKERCMRIQIYLRVKRIWWNTINNNKFHVCNWAVMCSRFAYNNMYISVYIIIIIVITVIFTLFLAVFNAMLLCEKIVHTQQKQRVNGRCAVFHTYYVSNSTYTVHTTARERYIYRGGWEDLSTQNENLWPTDNATYGKIIWKILHYNANVCVGKHEWCELFQLYLSSLLLFFFSFSFFSICFRL